MMLCYCHYPVSNASFLAFYEQESETVFFAKDYLNLKQDLRQLIFQTCRTPEPFVAQEITR